MDELNIYNAYKLIYENKEREIKYVDPDLDLEWGEAMRYPELKALGRAEWKKIAKKGKAVLWSTISDGVGNVDTDLNNLDKNKRKRVKEAIAKGIVEYPIVGKFADGSMDLIAGNTRIAALENKGYDPKVWVVNVSYATS